MEEEEGGVSQLVRLVVPREAVGHLVRPAAPLGAASRLVRLAAPQVHVVEEEGGASRLVRLAVPRGVIGRLVRPVAPQGGVSRLVRLAAPWACREEEGEIRPSISLGWEENALHVSGLFALSQILWCVNAARGSTIRSAPA